MARTMQIGLLVAAAIAILMATIFSLGQEQRFWERRVQYEIHFTRTNGLQKGAPVSLTGVTVGSVDDMRFPPEPAARFIQVLINVRADAAARIREDTVASIRTYGLLGDRYVELSAGSAEVEALAPGGLVKAIDPTDIEAVIGQSGDIATNVVEVTASLKDVLGAIQRGEGLLGAMVRNRELGEATLEDLRATMAHVQGTTRSLEQILARVDRGEGLLGQLTTRTADNAALLQRIDRSVKSIEGFADDLRSGKGALGRLVTDQAWADRVLGNLDRAAADLASVADKVDGGQGTLGRLVNDPALYDRSTAVVDRLGGSWFLRLLRPFGGGAPAAPPPAAPDAGAAPPP